jgi:hypothetical protein
MREEAREAERQAESVRRRIALIEAAIDFDTRALNIDAIPAKLCRLAAIEGIAPGNDLGDWLHARADELQEHGRDKGDNAALLVSIATWRAALQERTRDGAPLQWAMTQNNLGTALQLLDERESGTARLDEAVAAFRAALDVFRAAGAGFYVERTERNLARAEALLARRQP